MKPVPCVQCPLRPLALFTPRQPGETELIEAQRTAQVAFRANTAIIHEGQVDGPLYTLFSGWAFRFKTLSDGRRQILSFLLPGDFLGVQEKMTEASPHGVQSLTEITVCQFRRDALWELHRRAPTLGFSITWLVAQGESLVDDNLLSVGRRSAEERIATLLILLFKRAAALLPDRGASGVPFPLTQQHIADAMGLSLVHTNKTLRRLERRGLHRLDEGRLWLLDPGALARLADLYGDGSPAPRPLI